MIGWSASFAHHGGAIYDTKNPVTLKGTITDFEWTNPHVQIYFDAKDDKGNLCTGLAKPSARASWRAAPAGPRILSSRGPGDDHVESGQSWHGGRRIPEGGSVPTATC